MTRVLVTGGNGYIGRHAVRALRDRGADPVALTRQVVPTGDRLEGVQYVTGDVLAPTSDLVAALQDVDVLLHLAWQDGFKLNSEAHALHLSGHYRFLTMAAEAGVKRLAVAGTMHEVGYWEGAINSQTPCKPQSLYGIAKVALRELLFARERLGDFPQVQWLRMYYIVGDDDRSHSIFTKLLAAAQAGKSTFPFTRGRNKYDFEDIHELADQLAAAALQSEIAGTIECCSGVPVTLAERVERFISDNDLHVHLEYGAFPDRPFDSPGLWGDATTINSIVAKANGSRF